MSAPAVERGWGPEPLEEFTLFNAAFIALLINKAAKAWEARSGSPMPYLALWLIIPNALYGPARAALPKSISADLFGWIHANPQIRDALPGNTRALRSKVLAGVRLCISSGSVTSEDDGLHAMPLRRRPPNFRSTDDMTDCLKAAEFLARWSSDRPDLRTLFALWEVTP